MNIVKLVFFLLVFLPSFAFSQETQLHTPKAPINPRRATELELKTFLKKLNGLEGGIKVELTEFSSSDFSVYKNFCVDRKTNKRIDCGESYHTLWIADIENNGKPVYVWTDEVEGSGHSDDFSVYEDAGADKITPVEIPKIEADYTNISRDLFTVENDKIYFHLVTFIAQDKNGKSISGGANSNAAPGAYYSVEVDYKCLWSQGRVKVVERKKTKEKYE